ncbi:hypothetical protein ACEPAH_7647 [Sanghuangporus vaninii]
MSSPAKSTLQQNVVRNIVPIKLALLLCDTPVPAVLSAKGTYLDVFRELLRLSYPSSRPENEQSPLPFILDGFDVVSAQEYPDLDKGEYSGVLISGSKFSAYDNDPWIVQLVEWVKDVAERRREIKLIGICFGHQIIARALGGECVPNGGQWEVGTTEMELTEIGKEVFETDRPVLPIQQMHRDHVPTVPPSFHLLGSSPIAPVQGLVRFASSGSTSLSEDAEPKDIQILTVQGHPEFTSFIVNSIIDVREKNGAMSPEIAKEGRERAVRPDEGTGIIGRTIWKVLGVGSDEKMR